MGNIKQIFKTISKNKVLHYIASRYTTYFIQFINSLFIASFLGPYYLGIWGFITLILQYVNQFNLGIPHSVNAIISVNYNKKKYVEKIVNASFGLLVILSLVIILVFVFSLGFNLKIGEKYNFSQYLPIVILIGVIGQFNVLFSNIFRVYGRLFEMAFNQTVYPCLTLITIFIFKEKNLLWALVIVNLISFFISLVLYIFRSPVRLHFIFDKRLFKSIQIKGWYLFLYNTSFYLIIISTRSFISGSYSVNEFGYFTFAYSLTNVILLLLQSFSSLIYPKLINRMAHSDNQKIVELLNKLRNLYVTISHFLIHLAILLYPIFLIFFPEYKETKNVFRLIALSIVLYTNSFGYSGLLISRGKEKLLSKLSLLALLANVVIAYILINLFRVSYTEVIISTMISYLLFVILLSYYGRDVVRLDNSVNSLLKDIFSYNIFIPYFISLFFVLMNFNSIYFFIPLLLFIILNYKNFSVFKSVFTEILKKPSVINV